MRTYDTYGAHLDHIPVSKKTPNGKHHIAVTAAIVAGLVGGGAGIKKIGDEYEEYKERGEFEQKIATMIGMNVENLRQKIAKDGKATSKLSNGDNLILNTLNRKGYLPQGKRTDTQGNVKSIFHFYYSYKIDQNGNIISGDINSIDILKIVRGNMPEKKDAVGIAIKMLDDKNMQSFWDEQIGKFTTNDGIAELALKYLPPGTKLVPHKAPNPEYNEKGEEIEFPHDTEAEKQDKFEKDLMKITIPLKNCIKPNPDSCIDQRLGSPPVGMETIARSSDINDLSVFARSFGDITRLAGLLYLIQNCEPMFGKKNQSGGEELRTIVEGELVREKIKNSPMRNRDISDTSWLNTARGMIFEKDLETSEKLTRLIKVANMFAEANGLKQVVARSFSGDESSEYDIMMERIKEIRKTTLDLFVKGEEMIIDNTLNTESAEYKNYIKYLANVIRSGEYTEQIFQKMCQERGIQKSGSIERTLDSMLKHKKNDARVILAGMGIVVSGLFDNPERNLVKEWDHYANKDGKESNTSYSVNIRDSKKLAGKAGATTQTFGTYQFPKSNHEKKGLK